MLVWWHRRHCKLSKTTTGFIGLDVANGYTIRFVDAVKKLRDKCPDATIAAGNVVTATHCLN